MKRLLKWVGLVLLVVILGLAGIVYFSFRGLAPIVDGQKIPNVEVVKDGIVACYLVEMGEVDALQLALVDACNDRSAKAIMDALRRRHRLPSDVKLILLTHGDSDHVGGAAAFPDAKVMMLEPDVGLAEGRETRFPKWLASPKPTGVHVSRVLKDGELVEEPGLNFRVFAVPGHTNGSAAFLTIGSVSRVLFLGDSAEVTSEGKLAPAKRLTSEDPALNRESLQKLLGKIPPSEAAIVTAIAPAHSGMLVQGIEPLRAFAKTH
jgi:glyoxylase-like metal-dependent hydrolase (beta-lactamase superfamily II)